VESGLFGALGKEPDREAAERFHAAMPLVRERASYLPEIPARLGYLFAEPPVPPAAEFIPRKGDLPGAIALLKRGRELVPVLAGLEEVAAEALVKERAEAAGVKPGDLLTPLRAAITGARVSPPLFGSLRLLGAESSLERVDRALAALEGGGQ
jgi:glutamyl-tRNA synthetase